MSSSGSDPPRQPRDLQGLLRLCMETTEYDENASTSSASNPMDPERRQWLNDALNSMTTDLVQEMIKCIESIKSGLAVIEKDGIISLEVVSQIESSIDALLEHVSCIDNASDFYQIGGYAVFKPLFSSHSDSLKAKGAELLSEIVQNHPVCQNYALKHDLLADLMHLLDADDNENVRIKALYAVSCLIRDNPEAQQLFDTKFDGFSTLLRCMQSNSPSGEHKLRIKASFLIASLCRQQPAFRDTVYNMGFVVQLVALLHTEHDASHEHLFAALYALVSQHEASRRDCQRADLALESLLLDRIELIQGKSEFLEEEEYCKSLLQLCFNENDLPESER